MAKIVLLRAEPADRETTCAWLVADGHVVHVTRIGAEAIDFGYLFKPELLVTDWRLKCEYNGIEVAQAVCFANGSTKTILLTDCSVGAAMNQAAASNIFQIIMNPVPKSALLNAVSQALTEHKVADTHS